MTIRSLTVFTSVNQKYGSPYYPGTLKFETEKLLYLATASVDIKVEDLLNTLN